MHNFHTQNSDSRIKWRTVNRWWFQTQPWCCECWLTVMTYWDTWIRTEPSLMLLVTPVLFLLCQDKMSAVKKAYKLKLKLLLWSRDGLSYWALVMSFVLELILMSHARNTSTQTHKDCKDSGGTPICKLAITQSCMDVFGQKMLMKIKREAEFTTYI